MGTEFAGLGMAIFLQMQQDRITLHRNVLREHSHAL